MPEEINRILTDHCLNILFCPTENAIKNLKKEGFTNITNNGKLVDLSCDKFPNSSFSLPAVINVGDIMFDALEIGLKKAERKSIILENLKLRPKGYYLASVHRAENTDNKERLKNILEIFLEISKESRLSSQFIQEQIIH